MSIITIKVLRTISKIVLLIVGIGIIGYGGLMVYKSVVNKPQRVRITNVTDSAATITWVTDNPVRGVVYYKDEGSFLPGPLGFLGSKVAYDDRDFARAQDECVTAFNENAKNTKDEDFAVDGNNFDCENIPVEKLGAYYTHSVTIKDLDDSSTYFFVVGNGIWSWSVDGVDKDVSENDLAVTNSFNFKTGKLLEEVPTPNIAYGTVYAGVKSEEGYLSEALSKDSLVYAYLVADEKNSQVISSVTNTAGGWIFDKSNFRDTEGNLITDLSKATMMVCAQYEDVEDTKCKEVSEGLDGDTELDVQGNDLQDLDVGTKNRILERFEQLVGKVYAVGPDKSCPSPLPTITDDSTYTCDKNCESFWSVSGCAVGSSCMKKCTHVTVTKYGAWESTDWVKFGTVPGNCSVPSVCGECPSGTVENDSTNCKHRICQAGDWSNWKDGLSDGSTCTSGAGGGCSNPSGAEGACRPVYSGAKAVCENGIWVSKSGTCGVCSNPSGVEGDCRPVHSGAKEVCENGSWVPKSGTCDGGGSTSGGGASGGGASGSGASGSGVSRSCTDSGGETIEAGRSCPLLGGTCDGATGRCTGSGDGEASNTEYCTFKPFYDAAGSLHSCKASCEDGKEISVAEGKCSSFSTEIPVTGNPGDGEEIKIVASEINLPELNEAQLKKLVENSDDVRDIIIEAAKEENARLETDRRWRIFMKYCNALGGSPMLEAGTQDFQCWIDDEDIILNFNLVKKAYAQDSTTSGYTLYLPEYGMYSFELGSYNFKKETTNGNTFYIFYIEANNKEGFQMPADPDNPTPKEDIMLKSSSVAITHKKVASAQSYTLVKGINLVSFNFVPVSTDLGSLTAKGVIEEAAKKGVIIQDISSFDGGRWAKGYTCNGEECSGNDFVILPGKGYLVYATKGGEMTIPGYNLKSSVPVNLSGGWNLVGIHGYTTAYTARTLIDSMSKIDGVTANNVTWWPTSKGMYEGLQVTGEQEYGFDFPISPTNGYFVRISSFKPEDSKCKSLLWNEGGTLNGACGITK